MPADHLVTDTAAFHHAIDAALPAVEAGALETFGIAPSHPETSYGYIAAGDVHHIRRFVKKPPRAKAEAMLAEGGHNWKAGIFLMRADRFVTELERQQPAIGRACADAMAITRRDGSRIYPHEKTFLPSSSQSVDYAVMEGAVQLVVVQVDPGWSDVGGWAAPTAASVSRWSGCRT